LAASVAFTPVAFLASLWPDCCVVVLAGKGVGKMGTDVGELGTALRNWGSCSEKCAADGSRPIWGVKILRSGCEPFARWLSVKFPTVTRFLMECGRDFSKNDGGRQVGFLIFFYHLK
jgi:hypothetical protein